MKALMDALVQSTRLQRFRQRANHPLRLKYCTARSCFSAAARVSNVPRFLRLPVFASTLRE